MRQFGADIPLGWVVIPDLPHHKSARFLNAEEKEYAIRRLGESPKHKWDLTVFRRVLLSWQFWLLPTVFMRKSLGHITSSTTSH